MNFENLGSLVSEVNKLNPSSSPDSIFTYVDLGSVDSKVKAITSPSQVNGLDAPSRARQILQTGDVLVSTVRPNLNSVALVPEQLDGSIASTGFTVLRPKKKLDSGYLFHWVRSPRFIREMVRRATGASYPAISDAIVKSSDIFVPPIDAQKEISERLDFLDSLLDDLNVANSKIEELALSLYESAFSRDVWPIKRLGEITDCLDSKRKPVTASDRRFGSIPYFGANGQQGWIDAPLFDEPLVLVAEDGGHFENPARGVAYKIDGPSWVNNHAHVLRAGAGLHIEYLYRTLRHFNFVPFISGSTRAKLNQAQLNRVEIPVPPYELQLEFAQQMKEIDLQSEYLRRMRDEALQLSSQQVQMLFGN
ncbi:MAG: Type restriction enzyme specificity protein [Actinomycetota bacterium]|jgi:restriction endonuclease S subunit